MVFRTVLIVFICVVLAAMRLMGAHLHLHVDDHESGHSQSTEVSVFGDQHEHDGSGPAHEDVNFDFLHDAFAQLPDFDSIGAVLILAVTLFLLKPRDSEPAPRYVFTRKPSRTKLLRPPLRGPPLNSVA